MALAPAARLGKLSPSTTALFLCDMQERFRDLIHEFPSAMRGCQYLTRVANVLELPVAHTEQYPKVFKGTVPELDEVARAAGERRIFAEKSQFSMLVPEVRSMLESGGIRSVILTGIETHVCVQQTCLDLLEMGCDVHIPLDAVSSQRRLDREAAIERMRSSGAFISSAESIVFMLLGDAKHPKFKEVSAIIKEHNGGEQCRL